MESISRGKSLPALVVALLLAMPGSAAPSGGSVTLVGHGGPVRFASLGQALAVAKAGDTLFLDGGVFTGPENRDLVVDVPIAIIGTGPKSCVIDCEGASRAFSFNGRVRLEGLTIRNGAAEHGGAASPAARSEAS